MKKDGGSIIYSPSDLIRYLASPFSSWLDRCYREKLDGITPDEVSEEDKLLSSTGDTHEATILNEYKNAMPGIVEIAKDDITALSATISAIKKKAPVVYQAALQDGVFAGFADFLTLDESGKYQVWDTKLALSPKPYYPVQLCCYSEMLASASGDGMPERIGVILGDGERVEFRVEDFIHYYRQLKASFLRLQGTFNGKLHGGPEPLPRADHGRWSSYAEQFFFDTDHLVQVAGITVGQIKKLKAAGVTTMTALAAAGGKAVHKLDATSLEKLSSQARLQCETREDRKAQPDAKPRFVVLSNKGPNNEPIGLAKLPPAHPADVFFDMEGYPLIPGGLEYLFGTWARTDGGDAFEFRDWWAHTREAEKLSLEGFVDWVYARWKKNPGMHIYHYAAYECSAVRRLSTRHDTRQDEVDDLLRNDVFVDLYQIVRHALRVGEDSYSIKSIETLYRPKRATEVATASESIVQYARWMTCKESPRWEDSPILKGIRDYNEDDCKSNAELCEWLRNLAKERGIACFARAQSAPMAPQPVDPKTAARAQLAANLRGQKESVSTILGDLVDFHRRELKPMWWRLFDRAEAGDEALRDDSSCVQGIEGQGGCVVENRSLCQNYRFDASQECKLDAGDTVMFTHNLNTTFKVAAIDLDDGQITLKIGTKSLGEKCAGRFPTHGSIVKNEYVPPGEIPDALSEVATGQLTNALHPSVKSLLERSAPGDLLKNKGESPLDTGLRVVGSMSGDCLVIQGPPGTGKTYTASCLIDELLAAGKKVGVTSNSHKAIVNLLSACGDTARRNGRKLVGIKVGSEPDEALHKANSALLHVEESKKGKAAYAGGVVGGTAWLFSRPEWKEALDFLFIDEAGQVSLANAFAIARSTKNLVLLGDQMQLDQPIQGSHPGDAGLSVLQYALKDNAASKPDEPVFHAVVPPELGLFLGASRRMHPDVCRFISESIYDGQLGSLPECARQKIAVPTGGRNIVTREAGIIFSAIEHDGDIQRSDEEVERVVSIYKDLIGRAYTSKENVTTPLGLGDFLFIAPYNAQVRALKAALPKGARVGSVDKFQGQEAAVCILSLCSSYGEYGSRGLRFILDRSRINVAISRAKCLAIVVADPRIANAAVGSIGEMKLLNLFCKMSTQGIG